jgi:acetolactate synthase-1/2/3 large subunit
MVRQWQRLFYNERYSASDLGNGLDYVKLAEAMGCVGLRAADPGDVEATVAKTLEVDDRPVVAEFVVDRDEMVFPMVPAGGSNDVIITGPEDL